MAKVAKADESSCERSEVNAVYSKKAETSGEKMICEEEKVRGEEIWWMTVWYVDIWSVAVKMTCARREEGEF